MSVPEGGKFRPEVEQGPSREKQLHDKKVEYARLNGDLARAEKSLRLLTDALAALDKGGAVDVWDVQRSAALTAPVPGENEKTYLTRQKAYLDSRMGTIADISSRRDNAYLKLRELGERRFQSELNSDLSTQNNDETGSFDLVDKGE